MGFKKEEYFISKKPEYFTKFPNEYIQGDIKSKFGVSRKFYITYILIDKYRSYENYSWITVREILNFYGYKAHKNKPKAFGEILDVLEYMVNNKMIEITQDLDSVGYDTGIKVKIISDNFDYPNHFCKITSTQLDVIMMNETSLSRESLLMAFLYINSYIGCRPRDSNGLETMNNPEEHPEAFWRTIKKMSSELAMSKDTISQCLNYLTTSTDERKALFVKKEVGYIPQSKDSPPLNAPNIYVLNKKGYEIEIKWALKKMLEVYGVDSFINDSTQTENI